MAFNCMQDVDQCKEEGEPKVSQVVMLSEKVLPNTSATGQETIHRDVDAIRSTWEAFLNSLQQTKEQLLTCVNQWKEYEESYEHCSTLLRKIEKEMKMIDLKGTLKEKQETHQKLRVNICVCTFVYNTLLERPQFQQIFALKTK